MYMYMYIHVYMSCTYIHVHVRIYMYMYIYTYIVSGKLYGAIATGYNVVNMYTIVLLLGAKAV